MGLGVVSPFLSPCPSQERRALVLIFNISRKEFLMFTRVVECTIKPGKSQDFIESLREDIVPTLQKQPGFVDETVLVSHNNQHEFLAISYWKTQEDAERYHREAFPRITEVLKPFLQTDPRVRTFTVQHSLTHKIGAAKAA